jgi:hypothetical protein
LNTVVRQFLEAAVWRFLSTRFVRHGDASFNGFGDVHARDASFLIVDNSSYSCLSHLACDRRRLGESGTALAALPDTKLLDRSIRRPERAGPRLSSI